MNLIVFNQERKAEKTKEQRRMKGKRWEMGRR